MATHELTAAGEADVELANIERDAGYRRSPREHALNCVCAVAGAQYLARERAVTQARPARILTDLAGELRCLSDWLYQQARGLPAEPAATK